LLHAADLARALGKDPAIERLYTARAHLLRNAIEAYFGATLEGLHTYKYFKEHTYLRHWICLPLVMGIDERKDGTLDALFSKLWTDNGVRVEFNPSLPEPKLFWDRGTLYAFMGAFKAGAADRALKRLLSFSQTRLLGFHVPYVVEAWPEGNMAHLSAESALYCRIFTEGLLGIEPAGFRSFRLTPNLPPGWDTVTLTNIHAFGSAFDIRMSKDGPDVTIEVHTEHDTVSSSVVKNGTSIFVELPREN
jgi:hypothetical protein